MTRRRKRRTRTHGSKRHPAPVPGASDASFARALRQELLRRGGHARLSALALRDAFGGHPFTIERKRSIDAALAGAGLRARPRVAKLRKRGFSWVAVVGVGRGLPLRDRVRWVADLVLARLLQPAAGIVAFVAAVVTLIAFFGAHDPGSRRPAKGTMTGDLNVAVSSFTRNGKSDRDARALASDTADALREKLAEPNRALRVEVWGPDRVGPITGRTRAVRAGAAAAAARRINADLLVYGDFAVSLNATSFAPQFYFNRRKLPAATELAGNYGYGTALHLPFPIGVNPQGRAHIRHVLVRRSDAYATVFIGVGYYLTHSWRQASAYFRKALRLGAVRAADVLSRLFLGNVAAQQHRPKRAIRYYRAALWLAPDLSRARFGIAEAEYQVGHADCTGRRANIKLLTAAKRHFHAVHTNWPQSTFGSPIAVLKAKVAFGLGQVDLCASASGAVRHWFLAKREFSVVVAAYQQTRPELRDDAAEAHAGIGLSDLHLYKKERIGYESARREYAAAATITTLDTRRSFFYGMVGYTSEALGERLRAVAAYKRAAAHAHNSTSRRKYVADARRNRGTRH